MDKKSTYEKVAHALDYIHIHFKEQPALERVAHEVNLSPHHFQKVFTEWVGISPKKFLQFISVEHAKKILQESRATLFNTAYQTGLSGTGRLHDLFVTIEGMTPGEFKDGGKNLSLHYSYAETSFGEILIASTPIGICHIAFVESRETALDDLQNCFPNATYTHRTDVLQKQALKVFNCNMADAPNITLHLRGTDFQLKVWKTLLQIPSGNLASYGALAEAIEKPNASRAVGTAVGSNPVAYIIPCHRVIQSSGVLGNYKWNGTRKKALIGWEASKYENL